MLINKKNSLNFILATLTLSLAACGGGGGGTESVNIGSGNNEDTDTKEREVSLESVYQHFNGVRERSGLVAFTQNSLLEQAAQGHADYLVDNYQDGHYQVEGKEGFTGKTVIDRVINTGYQSRVVSEGFAYNHATPMQSIDFLMTAIYHRINILRFDEDSVGIGFAKIPDGGYSFVHNNGNEDLNQLCLANQTVTGSYYTDVCAEAAKRVPADAYLDARAANLDVNPQYIVWPPHQSTDNALEYDGTEVPDPLGNQAKSGNPVSLHLNPGMYQDGVGLRSFKLFYNQTNQEVTNTRLLIQSTDPNKLLDHTHFVLFPMDQLRPDTQYRAEVMWDHAGTLQTAEWVFTTDQ